MALVRDWRSVKQCGIYGIIRNECNILNLKALKRITIKYDPFAEKVKEIRDFNHLIYSYNALKSNPLTIIKTEILNDRSEPTVTFDLKNGETILMKCAHLKAVELFQLMNEYITPLAPQDDLSTSSTATTKSGKKKKR